MPRKPCSRISSPRIIWAQLLAVFLFDLNKWEEKEKRPHNCLDGCRMLQQWGRMKPENPFVRCLSSILRPASCVLRSSSFVLRRSILRRLPMSAKGHRLSTSDIPERRTQASAKW
ncbi:hypothetical protein KR018_003874 [Drosophila ironensis]|nr:hypothetical protein KR018_003874 [Drosophila ironensis]